MSIMYATSTTSMTSASTREEACRAGERRVRAVRLLRPRRAAPAFGFSLRGGKEFATGFFVSHVETNSVAHLQGLKVGDQVVSVNGYRVEDAVHSELVHYLSSQSQLRLLVKHVGMLPVKEKSEEPVSWKAVGSPGDANTGVVRITTLVPPKAKLGCGICKGPEWKAGIFVQFVRPSGIAHEAGLRPGDQILSCNGLDFAHLTFNQAVSALKAAGRLELVVRVGGGAELASPESSGYNSSASSAGGERSPAPHINTYNIHRSTTNRIKRRTWDSTDFDLNMRDKHNFDTPSDIEPDYDDPSIPDNPHNFASKYSENDNEILSRPSNKTIINLTEEGATIECSYDKQLRRTSPFSDKTVSNNNRKTIVLEIHHSTKSRNESDSNNYLSSKIDFHNDSASVSGSSTLSSAIAEEFKKRKLNKKNKETSISDEKNRNSPSTAKTDQRKQHDALIDEFKKVHRKMFSSRGLGIDELSKTAEKDRHHQDQCDALKVQAKNQINGNGKKQESNGKPPTPPPMPMYNGNNENNGQQTYEKCSNSIRDINNKSNKLVRTPTPDYNNASNFVEQMKVLKFSGDEAEIECMESHKLTNPSRVESKPPPNYFAKAPNGTATMKKPDRPVSVTIGEYGSRRQPSKLEFLKGADVADGVKSVDDVSISSRLQSELALTLSRSNLRKKTETAIDPGR